MECVAKVSKKHCSCTVTACDKHGNCCRCVEFHRSRQQIPGCFFSQNGELSLDRSLQNFVRDQGF